MRLCATDRRLQQVRNIPQNRAACYKTNPQQIHTGGGACWTGRTVARPQFVPSGQALLLVLPFFCPQIDVFLPDFQFVLNGFV